MHTIVSKGTESVEDPGGIRSRSDHSSPSDTESVREAWVKVTEKKTGFVCWHFMVTWEKGWRYKEENFPTDKKNPIIISNKVLKYNLICYTFKV